jgi:hypothetical protein
MRSRQEELASLHPLDRAAALHPWIADALAKDLSAVAQKAWTVLHPNQSLSWSWHYDLLCEILTLVKERKILRASSMCRLVP